MECIEYYGMKQGLEACKDWYDDFLECVYQVGASANEIMYCTTKLSYNKLEKCIFFSHEKNTRSFKPLKVVKNFPNIKDHLKYFFQISALRDSGA
jgi:hypothetical protein